MSPQIRSEIIKALSTGNIGKLKQLVIDRKKKVIILSTFLDGLQYTSSVRNHAKDEQVLITGELAKLLENLKKSLS
jgi:hypothetical protein